MQKKHLQTDNHWKRHCAGVDTSAKYKIVTIKMPAYLERMKIDPWVAQS